MPALLESDTVRGKSSPSCSKTASDSTGLTPAMAKLASDLSVRFHHTPKTGLSTRQSPSTRPYAQQRRPSIRFQAGSINKGVGHKIKKPKLKAKDKNAGYPVKVSVRRLKQVKPPPRLALHRTPAGLADTATKRRHRLSSPGVSLLESADSGDDFLPSTDGSSGSTGSGKQFFTSRARSAATVQITKNVMLSASYGSITLQQRSGVLGLKKNIGSTSTAHTQKVLPGVVKGAAPSTPSPLKTLNSASTLTKTPKSQKESLPSNNHSYATGVRSSPRRAPLHPLTAPGLLSSPAVCSPKSASRSLDTSRSEQSPGKRERSQYWKEIPTGGCIRASPRRLISLGSPEKFPNKTPTKKGEISPRKLVLTKSTPQKIDQCNRYSPQKNTHLSPNKIAERNVVIEMVYESPNAKSCKSPHRQQNDQRKMTEASSKNGHYVHSQSPYKHSDSASPSRIMLRNSPLRKINSTHLEGTPIKIANSPKKVIAKPCGLSDISKFAHSPSKMNTLPKAGSERSMRSTPQKFVANPLEGNQQNYTERFLKESDKSSLNTDAVQTKLGVKYFAIFDPEKRKSHAERDENKSRRLSSPRVLAAAGDSAQMMLDAGQQRFGAEQCLQCGLVYEHGDPDDAKLHALQHNRVITLLTYSNSKNERQVSNVDSHGGRCVLISPSDPQYRSRKVTDVLEVVDEELGFSGPSISMASGGEFWVFLYVIEGKVGGCLVAERIKEAFRVVRGESNEDGCVASQELLCCSTQPVSTMFGISRIWVRSDCRRMGVATKLVDGFRGNMLPCHYLQLDEFAFSDPTPVGVKFAVTYTKKYDFLVYRHVV